jgi:hypothetical protein
MEWHRPGTHGEGESSLTGHITPYSVNKINPEYGKFVPICIE